MEGRPGPDGDFVEAQAAAFAFRPGDGAFEHEVLRDAEVVVDDAGETGPQLLGRQVGEEAEPAEVDAEDWCLLVAHLPGGAEDGPVAAKDQSQVGVVGSEVGLLLQVLDDDHAVLPEEGPQPLQLLAHTGSPAVAQN